MKSDDTLASRDWETLAARGRESARAGRLEDAEAAYRAALDLAPNACAIMCNLGALRLQRGDLPGALEWYMRGRNAMPSSADAHLGIGRALLGAGRVHEAVASLRQAIAVNPARPDAHNALGSALARAGDVAGAEAAFRVALAARPDYPAAISNLCDLLGRDGRAEQAARELEGMRQAMPDNPAILFKLGYVKAFLNDLDAAESLTMRVTELLPDFAEAYVNLGTFAQWRQDVSGALANFRHALSLSPRNRVVEGNLAHALLYAGDYRQGWSQYETRPMGVFSTLTMLSRPEWGPRWNGGDLAAGTLLLHGEGGFGDVIQFCRYADAARQRAGRIVVWLERKYAGLTRLLADVPGVDSVINEGQAATAAAHCSMSSLPYLLWNERECPIPMPYLFADARKRQEWQSRMGNSSELRVGLAWRGGAGEDRFFGSLVDRRRSIPFDLLARLFEVDGVRFYSLQKGVEADEWKRHAFAAGLVDWMGEVTDFSDTAAFASALDLIVTVDTSVAHLAGGLGVDTWLLNRYDSCWRWGVEGTSTHWYPTMRLFRQERFGEWSRVIEVARQALEEKVRSRRADPAAVTGDPTTLLNSN